MLRQFLVITALFGLAVTPPAIAQDDGFVAVGLAVAQAPEAGLGVCFGMEPAGTMECAQSECMEQSGLDEVDCAVNLWCYPHGWTAQIAVLHRDGIHWTKVICDEYSREKLDATIALYCDDATYIECAAMRIWDADGTVILDYE